MEGTTAEISSKQAGGKKLSHKWGEADAQHPQLEHYLLGRMSCRVPVLQQLHDLTIPDIELPEKGHFNNS